MTRDKNFFMCASKIINTFMSGDIFDFNSVAEIGNTATTRDVIKEFSTVDDFIDLVSIDANSKVAGDQKFVFIGAAAFHKKGGELQFAKVNATGVVNDKTIVEGDFNADGKADFQIELTGKITLDKFDFIL